MRLIILFPFVCLLFIGLITYCTLINPEGKWSQPLSFFSLFVLGLPMSLGLAIMCFQHAYKMTGSSKTREEYLEEIRNLVGGGPLTVVDTISGENSYKVWFDYKNREYEFLDLLELSYNRRLRRNEVTQKAILLRTKTEEGLSILFQQEIGNTIIGEVVEKIMDFSATQGCTLITPWDLNNFYPEFRVFSNEIERAKKILVDRTVVDIIRSCLNKQEFCVPTLPLQIKNGFIELDFYYYVNIKKDSKIIIEYLQKIDALADRLRALNNPSGERKEAI